MIWNATQHNPTPEQDMDGVMAPMPEVQAAITFIGVPDRAAILARVGEVISYLRTAGAHHGDRVMIGGAPYLQGPLEQGLQAAGLLPVYSFTERRATEITLPSGEVKKTQTFVHVGWVQGATVAADLGDDAPIVI